MKKLLKFGEAIELLKKGEMLCREGWNGRFVFMQVPATVPKQFITKMTSLPDSVKAEFAWRMNDISYANQIAIVHPSNEIYGWVASVSDSLAEDWYIYEQQ